MCECLSLARLIPLSQPRTWLPIISTYVHPHAPYTLMQECYLVEGDCTNLQDHVQDQNAEDDLSWLLGTTIMITFVAMEAVSN